MHPLVESSDMIVSHNADLDADLASKTKTKTKEGDFQQAGIRPSAGGVQEEPPHLTVRDAEETLEARVDDLSLGVYAPSSHALVVKVWGLSFFSICFSS